jgi:hypothetical protein
MTARELALLQPERHGEQPTHGRIHAMVCPEQCNA